MRSVSRPVCTLFLALALSASAFAQSRGGGGGFFFGVQTPDWGSAFLPAVGERLEVEHFGAYGYGVARDGFVVGGFALLMLDESLAGGDYTEAAHLAGAAAGLIVGSRLVDEARADLSVCARFGLGGLALGGFEMNLDNPDTEGFAVIYAEPYAELAISITRWMALSVQLGYRFVGNFAPGAPFDDFFLRSPTFGVGMVWGKF